MANSPSSSRSGPIRTGCLVGLLSDGFVKSEQPISVAKGSGEADGSDVACPEGLPGLAKCLAPCGVQPVPRLEGRIALETPKRRYLALAVAGTPLAGPPPRAPGGLEHVPAGLH